MVEMENRVYEVGKAMMYASSCEAISDEIEEGDVLELDNPITDLDMPAGEYLVLSIDEDGEMLSLVPVKGLDYGLALLLMDNGYRVRRAGWNGKGMWITKLDDAQWSCDLEFLPGNENLETAAFTVMKTADNKLVPWLCSQTDAWAKDWEVVEDDQEDIA